MRRLFAVILALGLALAACAKKADQYTLKEGTPAYALAKDLAAIVPALGPDKTTVLVETKVFSITAAEVLQVATENLGTRADKLKTVDAGQLKKIIDSAATSLAERKLLLAAAVGAKTVLPPGELDKALQSEYSRAGSEQAFREALKGAGISFDHVKQSIEETQLINQFLAGVAERGGQVSEEELRRVYAEETTNGRTASVRHILIMTQGKTDAEKAAARTKIEGILAEAKAGADFAELAKKYSEDPGSKNNGGLYENFPRGQMVKPFEDAAFSVPVGEISGIVETTYGYHILKVIGRQNETRPFEEARAEIEARLKQRGQGTVVQDFIKGLKDKVGFKLIGL